MAANLQELTDKRVALIEEARKIHETATSEDRELSAEDQQSFDRIMADADKLKAQIESEEKRIRNADRIKEATEDLARTKPRQTSPTKPGGDNQPAAYEFEFRKNKVSFEHGTDAYERHTPEARRGYNRWLIDGAVSEGARYAALQTDIATDGGYLTTPEEVVAGLLKNIDDMVFMRGLSRVITLSPSAQTAGIRKRTAKLSSFAWGGELDDVTDHADSSLKFGKRVLTPHYMTGMILVSRDLLRAAVMSVESIVMEELARDAAELEEQAFISGNGSQRPLGVFTASADGVPTSRDVSTGNTTTSITFDGLVSARMSLKKQYRESATWLFHRDAITQISKLKDGSGQYLWQPSRLVGEPDVILGRPVIESEWVPNTFTTGLYVGMLADFARGYTIADHLLLEMIRLNEKYAHTNQVAFIARRKVDGAPVLDEAFARVKLA